jgi:uncharacterized metal-binding protein
MERNDKREVRYLVLVKEGIRKTAKCGRRNKDTREVIKKIKQNVQKLTELCVPTK